jgi:hypothetical protein
MQQDLIAKASLVRQLSHSNTPLQRIAKNVAVSLLYIFLVPYGQKVVKEFLRRLVVLNDSILI